MSKTLYQKYRPNTFEQVVGQDFIKKVLTKSIKDNKIQGTYLFSGPRGTGKTSIAKIFAKAINCEDNNDPLTDNCLYCNYFSENTTYDDIYELDAASNNGVDDIRKIVENVQYQPIKLKTKVYIIDEVHMLSKGAFNALLKTLEEPQSSSIFILATTEPNKIPNTILSRAQRFDFKRIDDITLKNHLKDILNKEAIDYEEKVLDMIVKLSDGCVRDALSLLQKLIIGVDKLTSDHVNSSLGILSPNKMEELKELILNSSIDKVIQKWRDLYNEGIDVQNFIIDFQLYLKELILKNDLTFDDSNKIINLIYKTNEIEQKAVYTKNLSNLVEVYLIDVVTNMNNKTSLNQSVLNKVNSNQDVLNQDILNQTNKIEEKKEPVSKLVKDEVPKTIKNNSKKVFKEEVSNRNSYKESELEELCFNVLQTATKESRINITKEFVNLGNILTNEKKLGLAKFFIEGQIKAANNNSLIVVIEHELVQPYNNRIDDILERISLTENIFIINEQTWNNLKEKYLNKRKNKGSEDKKEKIVQKEITYDKDDFVKLLEEKLKTKINIMEE